MEAADAIALIAPAGVEALGPSTWADLGCGDGTFTLALASLLAPGSTIHAMDREAALLRRLPSAYGRARIFTHAGDFTHQPWPFGNPDGILMANALHYVADQPAFLRACAAHASPPPRFLVVEYDTDRGNRWVPYPVPRATLATLFGAAGYASVRILGSRPSVYRQAPLYAAAVSADAPP
jgi:ubiquinone/menaquinone biosynthesis C-methylase UbiE